MGLLFKRRRAIWRPQEGIGLIPARLGVRSWGHLLKKRYLSLFAEVACLRWYCDGDTP